MPTSCTVLSQASYCSFVVLSVSALSGAGGAVAQAYPTHTVRILASSTPGGSTPEEMRNRIASEVQRWAKVIAEAGIPKQ